VIPVPDALPLEQPRRTLDDLVVSPSVKEQIDAAMARLANHQVLYHEWGLEAVDPKGAAVALNLYGPPGTGKTLCAEGLAGSLGRPFLRVSYAELESKYVGDTAKNLVRIFRTASGTGAVVFFDEADAVMSRRIALVNQSSDHALNLTRSVLLMELDRFDGIAIFATNLVESYDPAFLRRMFAHIRFELPDLPCRERLWRRLLPDKLPRDPDLQPDWLAEMTDGLSGADLLGLLVRAACRVVQRTGEARRVSRADIVAELTTIGCEPRGGLGAKSPLLPRAAQQQPGHEAPGAPARAGALS
jgi:SpoVK/Ycf46/Vps4 family AAA+-type ATPase